MKKTLYAVAVLAIISGVAFAETYDSKTTDSKATTKTTSTTKSSSSSMMKDAAAVQSKLEALERKTFEAFKNQDFKAMKESIANEGVSVDINGMATMEQFEPMMKDYVVESYNLSDWKLLPIDKDAAILTYTANVTAKFKGESIPAGPYYASTTYANRSGKWLAVYHQETLAASAMQGMSATH